MVERLAETHPRSQKLIDWSQARLADDEFYETRVRYLADKAVALLLENKELVLRLLEEKMERGAREHGEPNHTPEAVEKHWLEECLDFLGWAEVGDFLKFEKENLKGNLKTTPELSAEEPSLKDRRQ
jgi:hypothetical protein